MNEHGLAIHKGRSHKNEIEISKNSPSSNQCVVHHCKKCDFKTIYQIVLTGHIQLKHVTQQDTPLKEAAQSPGPKTCGYPDNANPKLNKIKTQEANNTPDLIKKAPNIVAVKSEGIKECDKCGKWFNSEREINHHKATIHITDKDAIIGVKRDESFMTKTESESPKRKRKVTEATPSDTTKSAIFQNTLSKNNSSIEEPISLVDIYFTSKDNMTNLCAKKPKNKHPD